MKKRVQVHFSLGLVTEKWTWTQLFWTHVFLLVALALGGCAHAPLRLTGPAPQPLPPELAAYYDYPDHTPEAAVQLLREQRAFRELRVQFPLSAAGFTPTEPVVEVEWFESTRSGRQPAILFNPILGGDYPLERGVCRYLARHGFHVALVHRKTLKISPEHQADRLELLLRQGLIRSRQVVDWMAQHERVDPARLGSFGISMGGIAGVMTAAVEPRLKAHVVALAGGSIAEILITSRDPLLTKPLVKYLAQQRMDRDTLERLLRGRVTTDPIRLAPYVDRTRVLLFIALFDHTVGRANSVRLRKALGDPETVFLPFGHYTSYLALPYLKRASLRFFRRTLL